MLILTWFKVKTVSSLIIGLVKLYLGSIEFRVWNVGSKKNFIDVTEE